MTTESGKINLTFTIILTLVALSVTGWLIWDKKHQTTTNGVDGPAQISHRNKRDFSDGLNKPSKEKTFELDETGTGIASQDVYEIDINNDKKLDRITRSHYENGTSHHWDEYIIEINTDNGWKNITPKGFRTTIGAECALAKIQFVFEPKFSVIKISRPWAETWDTPSVATKTVYELKDNKMVLTQTNKLKSICDVTELFKEI